MSFPVPPVHNALVVRPHIHVTKEEREAVLRSVEYNVFSFPAGLVTCDFLSDSGTSAMTDVQWAAMLRGDESYGRNSGYYCLLEAFRDIFERGTSRNYAYRDVMAGTADSKFFLDMLLKEQEGGFANGGPAQLTRPNFFIVPQGRCAEALLFSTLGDILKADPVYGQTRNAIVSNGFFDTTGANIAVAGFELQTFTQPGLTDAFPVELVGVENRFKGNLDIEATAAFLDKNLERVTMILLTITNNWAAAQPVSMDNIKRASELARQHGIPLFFDACRFAENAKFVQDFELGYKNKSIPEIVQEMFTYADGFTISLKKDGLANMGGALCLRDQGVLASRFPEIGHRLKERQIMCYGNDSYGGMSGRDLMAAAVGLYEVTKEIYLANRIGQVQKFAEALVKKGVPLLLPPGGHAVYLDMDQFFHGCNRSYGEFAALGFTLQLLSQYGIRSAEAGPYGWEWDKKNEEERKLVPNLVRFAVPRYVMTNDHIEYTVAAIAELHAQRHMIPGVEITRGKDMRIRHFSAGLRPIPVKQTNGTHLEEKTFLNYSQTDLSKLCQVLGLRGHWKALKKALELSAGKWGNAAIPKHADKWLSDVSLDHSPIEYSVAFEQKTGAAQLRFMIEAQAAQASIAAYQESALQLTAAIQAKYPDVSVDRFAAVQDLFFPIGASAPFAAWHSFVLDECGKTGWKIYLNPHCLGAHNSAKTVREAFARLGMPEAFDMLAPVSASSDDNFIYFSLDLSSGPKARVKVYVQHLNATPEQVARKMAAVAGSTLSVEEVQHFCATMAAGSVTPYTKKPLITTFGFTKNSNDAGLEVETVLHFPVSHYASHDGEIRQRVERYLGGWSTKEGSPNWVLEKYQKCVDAVSHRSLDAGSGIHAWVGLKASKSRGKVLTFYLEPEMFTHLPKV